MRADGARALTFAQCAHVPVARSSEHRFTCPTIEGIRNISALHRLRVLKGKNQEADLGGDAE